MEKALMELLRVQHRFIDLFFQYIGLIFCQNNIAFLTGASLGLAIFQPQTGPRTIAYGDWGNSAAPVFLAYGDPLECWSVEHVVDNQATSGDLFSSRFDGTFPHVAGMTQNNGVSSCTETNVVSSPVVIQVGLHQHFALERRLQLI